MFRILFALLSGVIFGLGLIVAGMANPTKVLAFLDITGHWDPSLALVMVGAIAVAAPALGPASTENAVGRDVAHSHESPSGSPFTGGQRAVRHWLGNGGYLPRAGVGASGSGLVTWLAVRGGDAGGHGTV